MLGRGILVSFILVSTLVFPFSHAFSKQELLRQSHFQTFQPQSARNFIDQSEHEQTHVLLQEDGAVDALKIFFLQLPDGITSNDVIFSQASSDANVLDVSGNDNLVISSSNGATLNVTCALSFDSSVGKTAYTLIAMKKITNEVVSSVTVPFVIVGMTFFTESEGGAKIIVSGDGNGYSVSYEEVLSTLPDSKKIKAFIQYANGSSSSDFTSSSLPSIDTLQSSMVGYTGQFIHDTSICNPAGVGGLDETGQVVLSNGCGYGLYSDAPGSLFFGFVFRPYSAGSVTIRYSWPGITSNVAQLSTQTFEFTFVVFLTGSPPVAVMDVYPQEKIWRPEGGELVRCQVINAVSQNLSSFNLLVENVGTPFHVVSGSYLSEGAPNYTESLTFITTSGTGTNLNWSMQYRAQTTATAEGNSETAKFMPGLSHLFSFDTLALSIDSVSPDFGTEEGGETITVAGHFPYFNPDVDELYFSGYKLPKRFIKSTSGSSIEFTLPPKSELGESYEFLVTVEMGNGKSNEVLFSFILKDATVRISQSGTSEIDEETYRVGDCTPVSFTAVITPFTKQIMGYKWSLHLAGDTANDLLQSPVFSTSNSSAQTLELDPDSFVAGAYTLKILVNIIGKDLEREILLLREHIITIGAFILKPPERTIAYPDTPLRLSAVVMPPGDCYTGNQTMMFEWKAFGETQLFSSLNATGSPSVGNFTTTPARLGWEYVVPRESLEYGNNSVVFKVWMAEDDSVFGQAMSHVFIQEAALIPVVRHGEELLTVNYLTTLKMFATGSYDPDVLDETRSEGLSYEWACQQSATLNFSSSAPCVSSLLPDVSVAEFSVPIAVLQSESSIAFVRYTLTVRKGMARVSQPTDLIVEIQDRGTIPFLDEYEIVLTNDDGTVQSWDGVKHYERSIISVSTTSQVSWSYSLLEPSIPNFFSEANLIIGPRFFSAEAQVFSITGNKKALGIEAGVLKPRTTYKFKILFDGSAEHEATSVVVSIRTAETPTIGFSVPSVTEGTQNTTFTTTAGVPGTWPSFSYYFILTDHDGRTFCVGGCTGYDVAHFRIGRAGSYTLSAYILDMQGKALIDFKILPKNITVTESGTDTQYLHTLQTSFEHGDDSTWTQMAHDLALILLEPETSLSNIRMLTDVADREDGITSEDVLDARMQSALSISAGSRKIFCSSFPNSYHGSDCMSLSSDLMKLPMLDTTTVYNIMVTIQCCVENTPQRTINKMGPMFPLVVENMNKVSRTIDQGGNSRRRLLQASGEPANLVADVQLWTGKQLSASVTSGQLEGYDQKFQIGTASEYGELSIVLASNPGHVPVQMVNGQQRRTISGPSDNELFFAGESCLAKMFAPSADKKRLLVLHTVDNFVVNGFQDAPQGSNLGDKLYWQQVYEQDENGRLVGIEVAKEDACYCWRLPIAQKQEMLNDSVDMMPGMYSVSDLKEFGQDAMGKGEVYNYVYDGILTRDYNVSEGWVEACQNQVGLVGSTVVARTSSNAIGNGFGTIVGTGGLVIVGLVLGGIGFVVVAMASAWVFAARSAAAVGGPLAASAPNELYVERDVYGRGTVFDANMVSLPSR